MKQKIKNETQSKTKLEQARPSLGARLLQIRKQKNLNLNEVSELTNIARSTLYKVERNGMSLTYDKLISLSEGLGVDIAELFSVPSDTGSQNLVTARMVKGKITGKSDLDNQDDSNFEFLCKEILHKRMVPFVGYIKARTLNEFGPLRSHPGEEFNYVIEGSIEVHTEHYQPLQLEKGECLYMDSTMPHAFLNIGEFDAQVLCVSCSTAKPNTSQNRH